MKKVKQERLSNLIEKLENNGYNVAFIEGSNDMEIESKNTTVHIEVYDVDNMRLTALELEESNLSELRIVIYNVDLYKPSLEYAYEMIENEIKYNERNGIVCI